MRTHQPGQAAFRSVLPDDIDWKPFPPFPPQARLAVVVGQPSEPGPYVIIGPLGIEYLDPRDDPRTN